MNKNKGKLIFLKRRAKCGLRSRPGTAGQRSPREKANRLVWLQQRETRCLGINEFAYDVELQLAVQELVQRSSAVGCGRANETGSSEVGIKGTTLAIVRLGFVNLAEKAYPPSSPTFLF